MCATMCAERNAKFYTIPQEYAGDNGVMIAWQGILEVKKSIKEYDKLDIIPKWRTDEVDVVWR